MDEIMEMPIYRRKTYIMIHNRMTKMENDSLEGKNSGNSSDSYDMVNKAAQMQQQKNKLGLGNT